MIPTISGETLSWNKQTQDTQSLVLSATGRSKAAYKLSYVLASENPTLSIQLTSSYPDNQHGEPEVVFRNSWAHEDPLANGRAPLETVLLLEANGKSTYKRFGALTKGEKIVPRGTLMVSLTERYFCQSIRFEGPQWVSKVLASPQGNLLVESKGKLTPSSQGGSASAVLYIGPRDYFYLDRAGFRLAFPIGILGKIGLAFLLVLKWLASITRNYGVAIILFSCLVTGIMAPFTLLSMKSMKRMQELKPESDRLMAKYKEDPKRAQQEIFALYKSQKVNPASGCLPLLLQMPIFIALFQALTHFIELRGQSFLWIKDLSMPDRLAKLPFSVPILGEYFNLLPLLMALAMYLQTKMSQRNMPTADPNNPAAQMMSGPIMSIMFCVMFYNFQSGLVMYWMINSLLSMVWYRLAR